MIRELCRGILTQSGIHVDSGSRQKKNCKKDCQKDKHRPPGFHIPFLSYMQTIAWPLYFQI
jgi:hypothetical protein